MSDNVPLTDSPMPQVSSPAHSSRPPQQQQPVRRNSRAALNQRSNNLGMIVDTTGVRIGDKFFKFLTEFEDDDGSKYYLEQLEVMEQTESTTMFIVWDHLNDEYQDLADMILGDYYRFEPYLRQSIRNFVRENKPNYVENDDTSSTGSEEKEFYISIKGFNQNYSLRELTTDKIGQLSLFSGTVTRTTQVRPELVYGTFECLECGKIIKNIAQQFKYTEPTVCTDQQCGNRKTWQLDVSRSKFVDWQKCRIQENSSDIPPGSMPRSIDVILRNEICETAKPGDNVSITGTLIVIPDISQFYSKAPKIVRNSAPSGPSEGVTGIKAIGVRDLNYKMVFLANFVQPHLKQFGYSDIRGDEEDDAEIVASFTKKEREDIIKMKETSKLYERMSSSLAPNIYGHDEIKRGILLMLFGGVMKTTGEGTKLRGDINICIIGDPSTAKSQFLQFVTRILPRTIYTSGKASSAAGLTAAVMRDSETGEFGIEAGALMLADNGICCIDEFDKMDAMDQAAIHEAMEQQTITITKAGIQATLNARASILAACNPVWGRYDTSKPMRYNINLSAPIISRFDLFFIVLDECDEVTDYHVAKHIINTHMNPNQQAQHNPDQYTVEQIQKYVRYARTIKPRISKESKKWFVKYYRQLRQRDCSEQKAYRFTVRQLESLIRLSEALARLHCDNVVQPTYVREACRLLKQSIISVENEDIDLKDPEFEENELQKEKEKDSATTEKKDKDKMDQDKDKDKEEQPGDAQPEEEEEQIKINYNIYMRTANLIVMIIRRNETEAEDGIAQKKIENLVLKDKEDEIDGVEEIERETKLIRFIIHRLIEIDHILLIKEDNDEVTERVLIVHPNYDVEN